MKKIEGQMADVMIESISDDVKADPELRRKLLQAKMDILDGKTYTTGEVVDMIERGEL